MKFYERKLVIHAEPSIIWSIFADLKNWPDWDGGLEAVEDVGAGLVENGESTFVFSGGLKATTTFTRVTENQGFNWTAKSMMVRIDARFDLQPVEKGQEVTYRFGMGGVLGGIMNLFMPKTVDSDTIRDLNSLKAMAERKQAEASKNNDSEQK